MKKLRWLTGTLSALMITAAAFLFFPPDSFATDVSNAKSTVSPPSTEPLPVIGTEEKLRQLLKKASEQQQAFGRGVMVFEQATAAPAAKAEAPAMAEQRDYSATNVQVQGVDEGDVIKTDGTYLYQASGENVVITRAYPATDMKIVKTLRFDGGTFMPSELYVDDSHLVVIGTSSTRTIPSKKASAAEIAQPTYSPTVHAYVYDIRDKAHIAKVRELELDGSYVSSRKIGSSLYLVSSKYLDYYPFVERKEPMEMPVFRDSKQSEEYQSISLKDTRYFPDRVEPNYLLIGAVNLDANKEMKVSSYLGSGENVYASTDHLYVTLTQWEQAPVQPMAKMAGDSFFRVMPPSNQTSSIYKFALKADAVSYEGKGEVPGTILNQFSLDEHNGYLRIATTNGDLFRTDEHTSKNNIYVLDEKLTIAGKLEGIAPGEKIYSARFMGDRAYMVTFKKVDPLFVIDLKQPRAPKILGALKIPGYSDYLHPYDENHVIGFGKDTIEAMDSKRNFAWYQGMKIALFDVTDVTHPVEQFKEIIGDRGTDSELLRDHRALLFSREKNLLAFPVTVMTLKPEDKEKNTASTDFPAYGEFSFQGAYVYSLDLKNGFQLRKKITHLAPDAAQKAGANWYDSNDNIQRILYIDDALYTVSPTKIKAFSMTTLAQQGELDLAK
ncbi:beta-propeller domain-containing protein [Brevibacillus fluminis]|uniref:beta-propeller domain-containing protein n=1 Tax=Brevibacillus fluminis TaxID=511487 RepID=UPI003F8B65CE